MCIRDRLGEEKYRVVTEAAIPLRGKGDGAGADALRLNGIPIGEDTCNGAGEMGSAVGGSPEIIQQQLITAHIVQLRAAVAGRVDTLSLIHI